MTIHKAHIYQEFDAPAEKIWEDMSDHENFGKMMGQKIARIVDSTDPGNVNGVGSVRGFKMPMYVEETITRSERGKRIEYKITKGTPLNHHYGTILFADLGDGRSSVDYTIEMGSKIPFIAAIIKVALEKGIGGGLKNHARRLKK